MELYHALNRGVDKRPIFMEDGDRVRFIHCLYEFNDTAPANNTSRSMNDFVSRSSVKRERIVDIHGWCVMGNHYHLLLSERTEGGISLFLRKLNIGYAKYFNDKYQRSGTLFQGRTKKVLVARHAHYLHILNYVHLNPLDFLKSAEDWRERKVRSAAHAIEYLDTYRWSSYLDYCGEKNFPSILEKRLFQESDGNYRKGLVEYLKDIEMDSIAILTLE